MYVCMRWLLAFINYHDRCCCQASGISNLFDNININPLLIYVIYIFDRVLMIELMISKVGFSGKGRDIQMDRSQSNC
jgi:hypothetical protein